MGFDNDAPDIFERQIKFVQESRIVTAMVGMLNAPGGSRLYHRLKKQGRLRSEVTGDNTDFTTNVIPLMGYEKLLEGYRRIINGIYSPRTYYERVKEFLREYKPLEKRQWRFHFRSIPYNFHYLDATFRTFFVLGIKDNARVYYWKLLLWSLVRRPRLLPLAMTYHVYGFHFRKVFAVVR